MNRHHAVPRRWIWAYLCHPGYVATVYLSTGQAAAAIGVHVHTLRRWVNDGLVEPSHRTPAGHARWDLDDLRRQLDAGPPADRERPVAQPQPADQPERPSVMVAIITSRLGVLAGRRNDGKPPWTFPAGENELHESPADTIIRETKEETGLLIKAGTTIGERVHPRTSRHMVYVAATPAGRNRSVWVGDPDELAEVRWLTLAEADELMPDMFPPVRTHLDRVLRSKESRGKRPRPDGQQQLV
jgi:8-oxo-dGTP pyrophosphatase MutT (NUDIX family)